jgi:hypothetical protein
MEKDESKDEIDWSQYGEHEPTLATPLDAKDYVALFIAALETIFLPLVILAGVFVTIVIILALLP